MALEYLESSLKRTVETYFTNALSLLTYRQQLAKNISATKKLLRKTCPRFLPLVEQLLDGFISYLSNEAFNTALAEGNLNYDELQNIKRGTFDCLTNHLKLCHHVIGKYYLYKKRINADDLELFKVAKNYFLKSLVKICGLHTRDANIRSKENKRKFVTDLRNIQWDRLSAFVYVHGKAVCRLDQDPALSLEEQQAIQTEVKRRTEIDRNYGALLTLKYAAHIGIVTPSFLDDAVSKSALLNEAENDLLKQLSTPTPQIEAPIAAETNPIKDIFQTVADAVTDIVTDPQKAWREMLSLSNIVINTLTPYLFSDTPTTDNTLAKEFAETHKEHIQLQKSVVTHAANRLADTAARILEKFSYFDIRQFINKLFKSTKESDDISAKKYASKIKNAIGNQDKNLPEDQIIDVSYVEHLSNLYEEASVTSFGIRRICYQTINDLTRLVLSNNRISGALNTLASMYKYIPTASDLAAIVYQFVSNNFHKLNINEKIEFLFGLLRTERNNNLYLPATKNVVLSIIETLIANDETTQKSLKKELLEELTNELKSRNEEIDEKQTSWVARVFGNPGEALRFKITPDDINHLNNYLAKLNEPSLNTADISNASIIQNDNEQQLQTATAIKLKAVAESETFERARVKNEIATILSDKKSELSHSLENQSLEKQLQILRADFQILKSKFSTQNLATLEKLFAKEQVLQAQEKERTENTNNEHQKRFFIKTQATLTEFLRAYQTLNSNLIATYNNGVPTSALSMGLSGISGVIPVVGGIFQAAAKFVDWQDRNLKISYANKLSSIILMLNDNVIRKIVVAILKRLNANKYPALQNFQNESIDKLAFHVANKLIFILLEGAHEISDVDIINSKSKDFATKNAASEKIVQLCAERISKKFEIDGLNINEMFDQKALGTTLTTKNKSSINAETQLLQQLPALKNAPIEQENLQPQPQSKPGLIGGIVHAVDERTRRLEQRLDQLAGENLFLREQLLVTSSSTNSNSKSSSSQQNLSTSQQIPTLEQQLATLILSTQSLITTASSSNSHAQLLGIIQQLTEQIASLAKQLQEAKAETEQTKQQLKTIEQQYWNFLQTAAAAKEKEKQVTSSASSHPTYHGSATSAIDISETTHSKKNEIADLYNGRAIQKKKRRANSYKHFKTSYTDTSKAAVLNISQCNTGLELRGALTLPARGQEDFQIGQTLEGDGSVYKLVIVGLKNAGVEPGAIVCIKDDLFYQKVGEIISTLIKKKDEDVIDIHFQQPYKNAIDIILGNTSNTALLEKIFAQADLPRFMLKQYYKTNFTAPTKVTVDRSGIRQTTFYKSAAKIPLLGPVIARVIESVYATIKAGSIKDKNLEAIKEICFTALARKFLPAAPDVFLIEGKNQAGNYMVMPAVKFESTFVDFKKRIITDKSSGYVVEPSTNHAKSINLLGVTAAFTSISGDYDRISKSGANTGTYKTKDGKQSVFSIDFGHVDFSKAITTFDDLRIAINDIPNATMLNHTAYSERLLGLAFIRKMRTGRGLSAEAEASYRQLYGNEIIDKLNSLNINDDVTIFNEYINYFNSKAGRVQNDTDAKAEFKKYASELEQVKNDYITAADELLSKCFRRMPLDDSTPDLSAPLADTLDNLEKLCGETSNIHEINDKKIKLVHLRKIKSTPWQLKQTNDGVTFFAQDLEDILKIKLFIKKQDSPLTPSYTDLSFTLKKQDLEQFYALFTEHKIALYKDQPLIVEQKPILRAVKPAVSPVASDAAATIFQPTASHVVITSEDTSSLSDLYGMTQEQWQQYEFHQNQAEQELDKTSSESSSKWVGFMQEQYQQKVNPSVKSSNGNTAAVTKLLAGLEPLPQLIKVSEIETPASLEFDSLRANLSGKPSPEDIANAPLPPPLTTFIPTN